MSFYDDYHLDEINNQIVSKTLKELESQLALKDERKVCQCIDCVQDMACFALNQIKPRYSVSLLGTIYTRVETEALHEEIANVVATAIDKVSKNPLHSN